MEPCGCNTGHATSYEYVTCLGCGRIRIGNHSNWGIAAGKTFKDLATARFYKDNGRYPTPVGNAHYKKEVMESLDLCRVQCNELVDSANFRLLCQSGYAYISNQARRDLDALHEVSKLLCNLEATVGKVLSED